MKNDPRRLALAVVVCLALCAGLAFVLDRFAS
jgi:hypothetical protein